MLRKAVHRSLSSIRYQSHFPKRAHEFLENTSTVNSELKNGVRVTSITNSQPTSTIGVYVDSGSRYETEENNGVANMLERVIYDGSKSRSAKQLEAELGKHGARLNSYTARDHTAYLVQVANENVEPVMEVLADVLRNPKITENDVETKKQDMLRQLEEVEANNEEVAWDMLHATAFQNTPMALSPYGRTEAINNLTRQEVAQFADDHYKGGRVVIAGAGGVSHDALNSFASKNFGDLSNSYSRSVPQAEGVRFTGSEYLYRDDTLPGLWIAMAMEGVGLEHPDALSLKLAAQLLGQWSDAHGEGFNAPLRSQQLMSQIDGLRAYHAFSVNYADTGLFGFTFSAEGDDVVGVHWAIKTMQRQWKYLATSVVDDDVDRAKNMLRTNTLGVLQNNASLAHWLALETLQRGHAGHIADVEQRIRVLDAASVREAVSRHVYDRDFAIAGVGHTEAVPNYPVIRYAQSWWRL